MAHDGQLPLGAKVVAFSSTLPGGKAAHGCGDAHGGCGAAGVDAPSEWLHTQRQRRQKGWSPPDAGGAAACLLVLLRERQGAGAGLRGLRQRSVARSGGGQTKRGG